TAAITAPRRSKMKTFTIENETNNRSEEHTSELQSRRDLVCRLLLEKTKKPRRNARPRDGEGNFPGCKALKCHKTGKESRLAVGIFFFKKTAPPEIYPFSLPDALPI